VTFLKGTFIDSKFGSLDFLAIPNSVWVSNLKSKLEKSWAEQIPYVSKQAYDDATYGYIQPLLKQLGTPPKIRAKRLPVLMSLCKYHQDGTCHDRSDKCRPGVDMLPECYYAPLEESAISLLATEIGRAWDASRYVFIIEGD
jgi:hypothetical protein